MIYTKKQIYNEEQGIKEILIPPNCGIFKLEITSGTLTVSGKIQKENNFSLLSAIKASDYSKVSSISDPGIYTIDVNGLYSIQLNLTGIGNVVYVLI